MTFGLIKNVKKLSKCDITGETAFKYNGEGNLISAPSIILTATLENTTVKQWQYKKADGSFEVYPNSSNTTTLTVNDTDDVFVGDMAVIKLVQTQKIFLTFIKFGKFVMVQLVQQQSLVI